MSLQDPIQTAADFVNSTSRHIFLTGKAGTGKTTFLRDLANRTHKNYLICAPTGIAALNANGVTIHSQFLLPFGSFIPDPTYRLTAEQERGFHTREILFRSHPLNAVRQKVLQGLELLVIDEVSMLRADVLDAIDVRLRQAKNNWKKSFGGVQVLFIGDLFQLPPILKDAERGVMSQFYPSIHFFHAHALRHEGFVYVELEKVFRQTDDVFINVLNNLRQNVITEEDRKLLNAHFKPGAEREEGVITLATHNRQVDEINTRSLEALEADTYYYSATVEGDFPESMYPCELKLELKVGAQVMFVKNDSSIVKRYYNGKLAKVVDLDEDTITVILEGETDEYIVPQEKWENTKYAVEDDEINPELKVVGAFYQYPIKLAWAVTIHKSQGLTFDKALIDVGKAFAPGQVYVALSRLRSLDGLTLRTPIPASAVDNDAEVVRFTEQKKSNQDLESALNTGKTQYITELVMEAFNLDPVRLKMDKVMSKWPSVLNFNLERIDKWPRTWKESFEELYGVSQTFKAQLFRLLQGGDHQQMFARLTKGAEYFEAQLKERLLLIYGFQADIQRFKGVKKMTNDLEEVDLQIIGVWQRVATVVGWTQSLLGGGLPEKDPRIQERIVKWRKEHIEAEVERAKNDLSLMSGKRSRKGKKRTGEVKTKKESTYEVTFKLFDDGKDIAEIAKERDLTEATIVGHLSRGVSIGRVDLKKLMDADKVEEIAKTYKGQDSLSDWKADTGDAYSYVELRLVQAHLNAVGDDE
ncbi:MAG: helicase [Bacteroidetes bacterium]|nr:MAG: helicase [Bacteroidota bacterium]